MAAPNANPGKPGLPGPSTLQFYLDRGYGQPVQLGKAMTKKLQVAKGLYDFSKQGGASSIGGNSVLANLMDLDGKDLQLPNGALIKNVVVDVLGTFKASAVAGFTAPQVALTLSSVGDLLAYTSATGVTGIVQGVPAGTVGTMLKVRAPSTVGANAGSVVRFNLKGGSLIGGKANVFIEYYLSD